VNKGLPLRMRFALTLVAALAMTAFAAPMALAQSPDDIPGFDQIPIPGGDEPTEDPTTDPGDGSGGGETDTPQVDAPGGGVDTGAGGLAGDDSALALTAAAAVAAMGGAVVMARRRATQR
jgi:hypothetical protein